MGRVEKKKIAAINEALPFKENTFDFVLARNSSLYYVFNNYFEKEEWLDVGVLMLEKIHRVLKPGGEARLKTTRLGEEITKKFNEAYPDIGCEFEFGWSLIILTKPLEDV